MTSLPRQQENFRKAESFMLTGFKDKTLKTLVLEPLASRRSQISENLRSLGINQITVASSVKDGISILAVEEKPFDWIVTSLCLDQALNGFHLLVLLLKEKDLRSTRVSFLLSEEEHSYLKNAFELGLLSWHRRDLSGNELKFEFETLFQTAALCNWQGSLLAAQWAQKNWE